MVKKEKYNKCKRDVEIDVEIQHPDYKIVVLKCGHRYKHAVRSLMEHVPISDHVTGHVISFKTEEDRVNGFYELISSKSHFISLEKNK